MSALILLAQQTNAAPFFAVGGIMFLIVALIGLAATIFWVWMLIDCLTSTLPPVEKLIWFLVIFFLHILGALIYFFVQRPRGAAI